MVVGAVAPARYRLSNTSLPAVPLSVAVSLPPAVERPSITSNPPPIDSGVTLLYRIVAPVGPAVNTSLPGPSRIDAVSTPVLDASTVWVSCPVTVTDEAPSR